VLDGGPDPPRRGGGETHLHSMQPLTSYFGLSCSLVRFHMMVYSQLGPSLAPTLILTLTLALIPTLTLTLT